MQYIFAGVDTHMVWCYFSHLCTHLCGVNGPESGGRAISQGHCIRCLYQRHNAFMCKYEFIAERTFRA